jgi:hypothetical protein
MVYYTTQGRNEKAFLSAEDAVAAGFIGEVWGNFSVKEFAPEFDFDALDIKKVIELVRLRVPYNDDKDARRALRERFVR